MELVPLDIPPGVFKTGTDMEASGRWIDASLVRWRNGSLRPVGGWRERVATPLTEPGRGMLIWEDNSGDRWTAIGSADQLRVVSPSGTASDIKPVSFTAGIVDAAVNTGYGGGFYGLGFYGTPREDTGNYSEATTWALDNWGENLVACSVSDGGIYEWTLNTGSPAAILSNAPTDNLAIVVTEERFLFALGAGGDPRKVQWSDREDNNTWTPAATNEAGSQTLQTPGQIMCGLRTRGQTLLLTDTDAHTATYIGPPFVYGFERVGTACGIISRKAAVNTDAGAFWMGVNGFYTFNGSTVAELQCDVFDIVFPLNSAQSSKVWAMSLGQEGEVWWFYPSQASNEIDRYVAYDYKEGHWMTGELSRTCGADRGVFRYPFMGDVSGNLLEHEIGSNYDSADVYAETGPISNGTGGSVVSAHQLIPDEETQGSVTATFKTRFHPNDTERTFGPYTMANPTDVRFTGRQFRMRVDGGDLGPWRVGVMRLRLTQGGRR